jgi:hypothetical protein
MKVELPDVSIYMCEGYRRDNILNFELLFGRFGATAPNDFPAIFK